MLMASQKGVGQNADGIAGRGFAENADGIAAGGSPKC